MAETTKVPAKESSKAKDTCERYLLLGPGRSLAKLAEVLGKPPGYVQVLKVWSRNFKWQDRAKEYDKEQAEIRRAKYALDLEEMNREHIQIAVEGRQKALARIEELIHIGKLAGESAVQFFKICIDLERLARGAATEQLAITGKDGGPVEMDIEVETHWGRNTDPRRKHPEPSTIDETAEEDQGEDEDHEEFGIDIPDDDE